MATPIKCYIKIKNKIKNNQEKLAKLTHKNKKNNTGSNK